MYPAPNERDDGWPGQRNITWWESAAILLIWTKTSQLPPLYQRLHKTGIVKAGEGRGCTPRAMGKTSWKERPGGQAVYPAPQRHQQWPPWIKACGLPESLSQEPQLILFQPFHCTDEETGPREAQGCTQSKGHICVKPRSPEQAWGHFHFTVPSTMQPPGN